MRFFASVVFPCTATALKNAFRRESKRCHPDLGGTTEQFVALTREYQRLLRDAHTFAAGSYPLTAVTLDGAPLSELGLGLGPTINGKDCQECRRVGYKTYTQYDNKPCPKRTNRRGWFICSCHGLGGVTRVRTGDYHDRCRRCNGTGEIEMFNPVIIKGSLARKEG